MVQNIPEIWQKERLSVLLQRKLEKMTIETETMKVLPAEVFVKTVNGIFEGMLNV